MPHLSLGIAVISTISPCLLHSKALYWGRDNAELHAKFRALCWKNRKLHKKELLKQQQKYEDAEKECNRLRVAQKKVWNMWVTTTGGGKVSRRAFGSVLNRNSIEGNHRRRQGSQERN